MKKTNVSTLKAHLAEFLRAVKNGQKVRIVERNLDIAEIVPVGTDLIIQKASSSAASFYEGIKLTGKGSTDSLKALMEERESR